MRTARLLTVEGCVRGRTQGGVPRGVYVQWGVQVVCAPPFLDSEADTPPNPEADTPFQSGGKHPPWTEWLTHACEKISLPQTSFADGN